MKKKRLFSLLPVLPMLLLLCGFSFYNTTVMIDTQKNPVYEFIYADDILSDFAGDAYSAESRYKYGYYLVSGKIESISERGDSFNLYGTSVTNDHMICSVPRDLRTEALSLSAGETVGVYGQVTVGLIDKMVHIEVDKIAAVPSGAKTGVFFLSDGKRVDKSSMNKRSLNNGRVNFIIPPAWKEVEHSITKEGLGTMEGYQYVLNALPGSKDSTPESFFVCYFDNASRLENADDKRETKLIEKAVINNISGEGSGDSARTRDVLTYYGAKYNYYIGSYTDALAAGKNGYHAEYIFQKNGDEGLIMYLYIYKDAKHLSDIMLVTRFLEVK